MVGTGGNSGYIADTTTELARGYAMSSTDTGHEGSSIDFVLQADAALDFAFRAVHLVAQLSKEIITAFYRREIQFSYYQGCSNGGRQGMIEATRFPEDFDGIVAGAPVFHYDEFLLWVLMADRAQNAHPLEEAELKLLGDASRRACDTLDGVEDGVINDPRLCTDEHYDPATLHCRSGQNPSTCLSAGQLATVQQHYRGVVAESGELLSPGLMPGAEGHGDWALWALPNATVPTTGEVLAGRLNGMAADDILKYWVYRDLTYDSSEFDVNRDRADLHWNRASAIVDVHTADLSAFRARGGKVLMYQGWNDYPLRPQRAIDYLDQVIAANGGAERAAEFFRLFMVPGMQHCRGGPGAHVVDYLAPLVEWVEEGKAPTELIGSRPDGAFTRRHCPFPQLADFKGGDPSSAESYRCAE